MHYYSKEIATLHDLLNLETRNFTNAEMQLNQNIPDWINHAGTPALKTVLRRYLSYVEQHSQKLAKFFKDVESVGPGPTGRVMEALIREVNDKLECCADSPVKDTCLLAAIQTINHFKISAYGTAAAFANALGMEVHAAIFHEAEVNEKQVDDRLSQVAQFEINEKAKAPFA